MKGIQIKNSDGVELSAELDLPPRNLAQHFAIFAHCFTCSKQLGAARNISRALTNEGIGVLRFDFTGLGKSKGDFSDTNFSANVQDIVTVSNWLGEHHQAPSLLVGHSLGGAAVLFAGSMVDSVKAIATVGAPSSPDHVQHLFADGLEEMEKRGEASVNIGGRPFQMKKQFLDDLRTHDMSSILKNLRKAILILHSPQDSIVEVANAARLYSDAHHPKSFVSLDGADHLLSNKDDSIYVGSVVANWAHRYLPAAEPNEHQNVLAQLGQDRFTTSISAGSHRFLADEPLNVGGMNLGPTPYDLIASGLAACTAMTIRMYAERKKWNVKGVDVEVIHDKMYSTDCEDCESVGAKIDHFDRVISLDGDLSNDQRLRLLEIANKCPVHKTLETSSVIATRLSEV